MTEFYSTEFCPTTGLQSIFKDCTANLPNIGVIMKTDGSNFDYFSNSFVGKTSNEEKQTFCASAFVRRVLARRLKVTWDFQQRFVYLLMMQLCMVFQVKIS